MSRNERWCGSELVMAARSVLEQEGTGLGSAVRIRCRYGEGDLGAGRVCGSWGGSWLLVLVGVIEMGVQGTKWRKRKVDKDP